MKFNIEQIFTWQNLMNIIDILIVWYIIYRLIMLVRGTKAVQLVKGISLIILDYLLSLKIYDTIPMIIETL